MRDYDHIAKVEKNGAILLGDETVADSFYKRLVRVVTHAHEDHIRGLKRSTKESMFIVATPVTHEFLKILGFMIPEQKIVRLDYNREIDIEKDKITLKASRHIAGSAQVIVESINGVSGYTGDFKMPGTEPLRDLDVLVLDATYGNLKYQRGWADWDALAALINIIEKYSGEKPIWIYGYNGKLQEIMIELRSRGIKNKYLADEKTIKMAKIASEFYNVPIGDVSLFNKKLVDAGTIVFMHAFKKRDFIKVEGIHVNLTGWEMRGIAVRIKDNLFNVSFSDHATFKEIIEYVKESRPKRVIIDGSRSNSAWYTAKYLSRVMNIDTKVEPENTLGW
ncbi:MAG: MBL fold metallo-hydrolase [Caldisphaeraceae archaeon]|nr:MBL fold metallo-hydrolase [Caldisphaeraceae archaeon]